MVFLLLLVSNVVHAVTKTSTGNGNWNAAATWNPSGVPVAGDDVNISHNITINSSEEYTVNSIFISSKLTVNGTLTINGDLSTDVNGEFDMGPNAVVIVKGNVLLGNKCTIDLSSYFIVLGNFTKSGSDSQGSITANNAHIYIIGTTTAPPYFTVCDQYSGTTSNTTSTCDGGTFEALITNPSPNPIITDIIQQTISDNTTGIDNLTLVTSCFCVGSSATLTIGESSTIALLKWYRGTTLLTTQLDPSKPYTYTADQVGTYNALYKIGTTWYQTNSVTITSSVTPTATISGTATICAGTSTQISIALGGDGPWNFTYTDGTTPVNVTNQATSPYIANISPLATKTYTLTNVSNSCCTGTTSGSALITVNPASTGGTISGGTLPLCLGNSTGVMTLTGYSGTIVQWEYQINSGGWNNIGNGGNANLTHMPWAAGTWEYRVAIQEGTCPIQYSDIRSFTVDAVSVGGWIAGNSNPICSDASTSLMTLTGSTGDIVRWEKRVDNESWSDIANTLTTYSEIPTSDGIWEYRALAKSGSCSGVYSTSFPITVNPTLSISLGTNPTITVGTTSALLTYSGTTGSPNAYSIDFDAAAEAAGLGDVSKWGLSASPISINVPWNIAPGLYHGNLTVSKSWPVCTSVLYPITITVSLTLSAPTASNNGPICEGSALSLTASTVAGATYSWTGPNNFTSAEQNPTITNATAAASGTYSVTATLGGSTSIAGTTNAIVNAIPTAPTVTLTQPTCTVSTGSITITAPTGTGMTYSINGSDYTNTDGVFSGVIAGIYNVTAKSQYECISSVTIATINAQPLTPAQPTIAADGPIDFCSGGSVKLTSSLENSYLWSTGETTQSIIVTTSGSYTVQVTSSTGCQSVPSLATTVTVNALPSAPTAGSNTYIYDGTSKSATANVGTNEIVDWYANPSGAVTASAPSGTNAGTYSAYAETRNITSGCISENRTLITLTINTATLTVTASSQNKTYGETVSTTGVLGTTFSVSGVQSGDVISGATLAYSGSPAGNLATAAVDSYTITPIGVTFSNGLASNYTFIYNTGALTVEKATVTITATAGSKTYGTLKTYLGTEFTSGTLYNGDEITGVSLSSIGDLVTAAFGTYEIVPSEAVGTGLGNYSISYVSGTLTVDKATVTVTATSGSKIYGTLKTYLGTEFTTSGTLYNSDEITGVSLSSLGDPVSAAFGTYDIVPSAALGTGLGNYSISYVDGTLTVNKATITVTATAGNKTYGTLKTYMGTEFTTSGTFYNSDGITGVSLSSAGDSDVAAFGTYPIVPSAAVGTGLGNYSISYVDGTLTVNKATITVTAAAGTKTYGTLKTYLGIEFTASGTFYNSDGITSVSLSSTGDPVAAAFGTYPIVPSAGVGTGIDNYTITYVNGTLTVYPIEVIATSGASLDAGYPTVKAAFDAINLGTHQGVILIKVHGSTTETASAVLNASGGSSSYTSVLLYPTATDLSISGNLNAPLIDFDGADNVTIDGRANATGSAKDLTISNTSTNAAASTIRFIHDGSTNNVQYCTIQGSSTVTTIGTILFSTGTTTGNDGNTIANNMITAAGSTQPMVAICSIGTAGKENSNNTINGNNIEDFLRRGIDIASGSSQWTISSNSLYNGGVVSSIDFAANTDFYGIRVVGGSGYIISGNYIGGSAINAGGSNAVYGSTLGRIGFYGISLGTTTTFTKSEIKSNTIAGITINSVPTASNSVTFHGIETLSNSSNVVIGGDNDADGNTVGSSSGNGSIAITTKTTVATYTSLIRGIYSLGAKGTDGIIKNNKIGGIDLSNTGSTAAVAAPSTFLGIYAANASAPSVVSNSVGLSQNESIRVLSTSQAVATTLTGIQIATGTNTIAIDGNTVQNITLLNATNTTGTLTGILSATAANSEVSIINNTLNNFNVIKFNNGSSNNSHFIGINNTGAIKTLNITGNTIKNFVTPSTTGNINFIRNSGAVVTTINISNNFLGVNNIPLVTFSAANAGSHIFIYNLGGRAASALSIKENDFRGVNYTGSNGTGANTFILNSATTLSQDISGNTFTSLNVKTINSITFISNSIAMQANGSQIVSGNNIVTGFNKSAAGGTVYGFTSTTATVNNGAIVLLENNNFSNITVTGNTAITGILSTDTGAGSPTKTIRNNTLSYWTGGTGLLQGISVSGTGASGAVTENIIRNSSNGNSITGITTGAGNDNIYSNQIYSLNGSTTAASVVTGIAITAATTKNVYQNSIYGLATGTGVTAGAVRGISIAAGTTVNAYQNTISGLSGNAITTGSVNGFLISGGTTVNAYQNTISGFTGNALTSGTVNGILITAGSSISASRNKVYDLSSSSTVISGTVNGIVVSGSVASLNATIVNNIVGDLRATSGNGADLVRGISVANTGTTSSANLYYNTVYLNASSAGTNFGTSGIYHAANATATIAALDLRNNLVVNSSTPKGSGKTVAYRRSSATLANYTSSSDNNSFYAGTSGANNLIYNDGANSDQTLQAYQTRVAPRDQASVTVNPVFLSTTGSDSNFLHLDAANCELDGTGKPVLGFTIDFDNETRDVLVPDIGADEFVGPPKLQVSVTVAADPSGPVCSGKSVTFTATPVNGGSSPTYQWYNGITPISGQTGLSYTTNTLVNGDNITVKLTSSAACVKDNPATSIAVAMVVNALPVPVITGDASPCNEAVEVIYKTEPNMDLYVWTVSGGVITSGQGTDTVKVSWNTAGAQAVTVNYTNANGCIGASATSYPITVHPLPNPGNFE